MNMVVGFRPQVYCVSACLSLTMLKHRKKNISSVCKNGTRNKKI